MVGQVGPGLRRLPRGAAASNQSALRRGQPRRLSPLSEPLLSLATHTSLARPQAPGWGGTGAKPGTTLRPQSSIRPDAVSTFEDASSSSTGAQPRPRTALQRQLDQWAPGTHAPHLGFSCGGIGGIRLVSGASAGCT